MRWQVELRTERVLHTVVDADPSASFEDLRELALRRADDGLVDWADEVTDERFWPIWPPPSDADDRAHVIQDLLGI